MCGLNEVVYFRVGYMKGSLGTVKSGGDGCYAVSKLRETLNLLIGLNLVPVKDLVLFYSKELLYIM